MKNFILIFLLLCTVQVIAQNEGVDVIPNGTKFIGGNFSFSVNESTDKFPDADDGKYTETFFGFGPLVGIYFRDNVAFGLSAGYNFSNSKNQYSDGSEYKRRYQSVGVGAFVRKNYKIIPNLFFFVQGDLGLSFGNDKTIDASENENKTRSWSTGIGCSPGLQIFLGNKVSLETTLGSVGYRFYSSKDDDSDVRSNSHHVGINGGLSSVSFSVRYFFFQ